MYLLTHTRNKNIKQCYVIRINTTRDHLHAPPAGACLWPERLRPHFEKYFPIAMFSQLKGGHPKRVMKNYLKSCKDQGLKNSS